MTSRLFSPPVWNVCSLQYIYKQELCGVGVLEQKQAYLKVNPEEAGIDLGLIASQE